MSVFRKRILLVVFACAFLLVSGCAASVSALIEDLGSESAEKAQKAVEELGKRGDEAAVPLEEALADPSPAVRINAALALYEIEGEQCSKRIVPLLSDETDNVRAEAVKLLQKTGDTGILEIVAGADKYSSVNYFKSGAAVISAMGEEGMTALLDAYDAYKESVKRLAQNMVRNASSRTCNDMLKVVTQRGIDDPLKIAAGEIFCELGMDELGIILEAYFKADETNRQNVMELMLLMYGSANGKAVLNELYTLFEQTEDFSEELLKIYAGADDVGREQITKAACKLTEKSSWLIERVAAFYGTKDAKTNSDITELYSSVGLPAVKAVLNFNYAGSAARSLEILKAMDKEAVVRSLSTLLGSDDDLPKVAEYIGKLGYPEFAEVIASYPMEDVSPADADDVLLMVSNYAQYPKIDAKIKSLCQSDYTFRRYVAECFSPDSYEEGLKVKTKGEGDGRQDKIVILGYYYGEYYDQDSDTDKARYSLSVSPMSFELIPTEKQLSLADSASADTAVYIKTKPVNLGSYYFKTLHKSVKGCRQDYVITVVDLRTKTVLGSKTLKGYKLPKTIYDSDVMWSAKKYLGEPPDGEDVKEAIIKLLEKYTS